MNGAETMTPEFRIEELRSENEVQKFSPERDILTRETGRPALFGTYQWLMTWRGANTDRAFQRYFSEGVQPVNLPWGDRVPKKRKWTSNFDFYDELFIFKDDIVFRCLFFLYHRLMLYRIMSSTTDYIYRLQWRLFRNRT